MCLVDLDGEVVLRLSGHARGVNATAWAPDGSRLATASHDGTVRLWDGGGACVRAFGPFPDSVESIDYAPDGARLLAALRDGTVRWLDVAGGGDATLATVEGTPARTALDDEGAQVAIATDADRALVVPPGGTPYELPHPGPVYSLAWSADGRLATACEDGVVRVYCPVRSGAKVIARTEAARRRVLQVAWRPDAGALAAGYGEGVARVFDADWREALAIENAREVTVLAWTPDADVLAVGSGRGDLAIHRLGPA